MYDLRSFRMLSADGFWTEPGAYSFCSALWFARDLLKNRDFIFIEWEAQAPAFVDGDDLDPIERFPFWCERKGLLTSQWPAWFRSAYRGHIARCSENHAFVGPRRVPRGPYPIQTRFRIGQQWWADASDYTNAVSNDLRCSNDHL